MADPLPGKKGYKKWAEEQHKLNEKYKHKHGSPKKGSGYKSGHKKK